MESARTARTLRSALRAVMTALAMAGVMVLPACSGGEGGAEEAGPVSPGTSATTVPSGQGPTTTVATVTIPTTVPPRQLSTTTTGTPGTSTPGTSTGPTSTFISGAGTEPVTLKGEGDAELTKVRVAGQQASDRLVFEFKGAVPEVRVAYTDRPVRAEGSGDEVQVAGDRVILVTLDRASGGQDLLEDGAEPSYGGANRLNGTGRVLQEVRAIGDFEAQMSWAVGVRGRPVFKVTTLQGPPRVVVDLAPR